MIRVAFTLISSKAWTGGYNYLVNLFPSEAHVFVRPDVDSRLSAAAKNGVHTKDLVLVGTIAVAADDE